MDGITSVRCGTHTQSNGHPLAVPEDTCGAPVEGRWGHDLPAWERHGLGSAWVGGVMEKHRRR